MRHYSISNLKTEHHVLIISPKQLQTLRVCVVLIYHNSRLLAKTFLSDLDTILCSLPNGLPAFILGDFNINLSINGPSQSNLKKLISYHGFLQTIQRPTHRRGGLLDNIYFNRFTTIHVDIIPTYYSDHFCLYQQPSHGSS